jgi:hypothetical protein
MPEKIRFNGFSFPDSSLPARRQAAANQGKRCHNKFPVSRNPYFTSGVVDIRGICPLLRICILRGWRFDWSNGPRLAFG